MKIETHVGRLPAELREVILLYMNKFSRGRPSMPAEEVVAELRRLSPKHAFDEDDIRAAITDVADEAGFVIAH
jgi:hypothetical protein